MNNKKRNQLEAIDPDERVQFRENITEFLASIIRHHTDALNAEAPELQQNIEQTYQVISTVDFLGERVYNEVCKTATILRFVAV